MKGTLYLKGISKGIFGVGLRGGFTGTYGYLWGSMLVVKWALGWKSDKRIWDGFTPAE